MSTMTPPTVDSAAALATHTGAAVRELQDRLRSTQRHLISHRIGVGLCSILAFGAVCLAVSATLDWFFELASVWRAAWIIGIVAIGVFAIVIGWKRRIASYTLSDTAVDAERRLSRFGQRLRTTLDYEQRTPQPAAASPSLLNSLHDETLKLAEQTEWRAVVDSQPLLKAMLVVVAVAFAWMASLILLPEFRIAAARALLLPFEYTTVSYSPESATVRPGESVTVTAIVSGRPVSSAQLRYRAGDSQAEWVTVDLVSTSAEEDRSDDEATPQRLHGELSSVLNDLRQDTQFEVLAGPRPLPGGFIRVLQPLTLEKSEVHIVPPSYTGRPEETVTTLDLKVLEGSTLELKLELNRSAAEASLTQTERPSESKPPGSSSVAGGDSATAVTTATDTTRIPLLLQDNIVLGTLTDLRKNVSFTLSAHTADGMSLDSQKINIRVQPDLKPQVQFIEPPEELVVTATTEVPMIVEAGDDLGLHKVGVMFQVGSGPMQTLLEQDAAGSAEPFRLATTMLLEEHRLTIQDAVNYYAFAEDNYFDQPRRTTTPLRFIDIRPYRLEFQVVEMDGEPGDGSSVTLEELITRQRQALSQAFQFSQQTSVTKETVDRLVEGQEDVLDATFEFSVGMAQRGAELPSLDEAITHMDTAIEALSDKDLTNAVAAEQLALAALIRTRENLRKLLNQSSSSSASAQRKFDRQMRQKLRMPKKKQSDQQEQLAQTRQKLEDLAKREREWSKQASQCCNSAASSSGKPSQSTPSESQPQDSGEPSNSPPDSGEDAKTPSPAEVAAAQEKLQAELAELQKQLEKLDAAGQAARQQANQAAESMTQGLAELKENNGDAAAKEGERAAEQLEELSAHLAAKNARDFGQRLDEAQKAAQQLASRQQTLEQKVRDQMEPGTESASGHDKQPSEQQSGQQPGDASKSGESSNGKETGNGDGGSRDSGRDGVEGLARDQQALAMQTEMLAELLDGLERDAPGETGGVQQKLQQAQAENPPRDIAAGMSQTANDLQARKTAAAGRGAAEAQQRLQELSKSLGVARGEYAQPQLKELMALEEQLAQLQEQMKRAQGKGDESKVAAGKKWQQLESRLDALAAADQRLAEAMRQVREGAQSEKSGSKGEAQKDGQPADSSTASDPPDPSGSTATGNAPPKPGSQLKPAPFVETNGQETPEGFYSWLAQGDSSGVREVSKALQAKIQEAILAGALMDADQPVPPAYRELVEKYYRALSDDLR